MPTLRELNQSQMVPIYDLEPDIIDDQGRVLSWRKKAKMADRGFGFDNSTDLPMGKLEGSYPTGKGRGNRI